MTAEAYVDLHAKIYDEFWSFYPTRIARSLLRLPSTLIPDSEQSVLDVGCGTGIVAAHFLRAGYRVAGLDISKAMLDRAQERFKSVQDKVTLIHGDATDFTLPRRVPFAFSTYDIPNHLRNLDQVAAYLRSVYDAVEPGGLFAFDLTTARGLEAINRIWIKDEQSAMFLFRGAMNQEEGFGFFRISGVVRAEDGRYDRFESTIVNTAHSVTAVADLVAAAGWVDCVIGTPDHPLTPVEQPEDEERVLFVARKPPVS
ncbi:class I SAM-dependent DNA methyltransferase [Herbidospora mongoliensis]|uniref:class I SAM-dependent DNA methyltransferase n=1 Tax=Herbidospora mongoliensis TaxID=688067 RepID=UPI0008311FC1|nr:methyltransferase domain-containing protein [Herbidospora mongoliensis]